MLFGALRAALKLGDMAGVLSASRKAMPFSRQLAARGSSAIPRVRPDLVEGFRVWPVNEYTGGMPGRFSSAPPWFGQGTPPPARRDFVYAAPFSNPPFTTVDPRYMEDGRNYALGYLYRPFEPRPWETGVTGNPRYRDLPERIPFENMTPQEIIESRNAGYFDF